MSAAHTPTTSRALSRTPGGTTPAVRMFLVKYTLGDGRRHCLHALASSSGAALVALLRQYPLARTASARVVP